MPLTDNLIVYYKCDEASGNLLDAHSVGPYDLTDNNTVTSAAGKINTARQFTAANSESFSRADNAALSTGDIDFTWAGWAYFDSAPGGGNGHTLVSKWDIPGTQREYALVWENSGTSRLRFYVSSDGLANSHVDADTLGVPSTGTWYFVVAWHDSVNNTINIQVNDGTVDSLAYSSGVRDGTGALYFGSLNDFASYYHDGRMDEWGFWKRVLTGAERTSLYNGGAGLAYPFGAGAAARTFLTLLGVGA